MSTTYWLPTIPVTPVDIINRSAAATGSLKYASLSECSNYNGHYVFVDYRKHAVGGPRWIAEYTWAGRRVLGRGSFRAAVEAAKREYDKGARGGLVKLHLSEEAEISLKEQIQVCEKMGFVPYSKEIDEEHTKSYETGQHTAVRDALQWGRHGFMDVMKEALHYEGTAEDWPKHRQEFFDKQKEKLKEKINAKA